MKLKLFYVYGALALAALVVLVFFTTSGDSGADMNGHMPDDDVHRDIGDQPVGKGNISGDFYQEMEMLRSDLEANPKDTAKMKAYADYLTAAHQFDGAIPVYNQILERDDKRTDVYFALTFIYYNKKDFNKGVDISNKVLSYDKNNAQAKFNLGVMESGLGNKDKAREIWTGITKDYPGSEPARLAEKSLARM